jgi:hypothetical protein
MENNNILEAEYMSENKSKDYRVLYKYKDGNYGISDSMTEAQAKKYAEKCIECHYGYVIVVKEILEFNKETNKMKNE